MFCEVYEGAGGQITVVVFDANGVSNIITGFEDQLLSPIEFQAMLCHYMPYSEEFDPDDFGGMDMNTVYEQLSTEEDLIAEVTEDGLILPYPEKMGSGALKLFEESVWESAAGDGDAV